MASISLAECIAILETLMPLEGLAAQLSARRMPAALCKQAIKITSKNLNFIPTFFGFKSSVYLSINCNEQKLFRINDL